MQLVTVLLFSIVGEVKVALYLKEPICRHDLRNGCGSNVHVPFSVVDELRLSVDSHEYPYGKIP